MKRPFAYDGNTISMIEGGYESVAQGEEADPLCLRSSSLERLLEALDEVAAVDHEENAPVPEWYADWLAGRTTGPISIPQNLATLFAIAPKIKNAPLARRGSALAAAAIGIGVLALLDLMEDGLVDIGLTAANWI